MIYPISHVIKLEPEAQSAYDVLATRSKHLWSEYTKCEKTRRAFLNSLLPEGLERRGFDEDMVVEGHLLTFAVKKNVLTK